MYYVLLAGSALLFSVQFLLNEKYQKQAGSGWDASLKFSLYSSVTGLAVLLIIHRFRLEVSLFSVLVAAFYSAILIGLNACSVCAFQWANLSVYSVFSMVGGMLLPFLYGVICGEKLTGMRIACCLLIAVSVLMNLNRGSRGQKAFRYYMAVFVLNGMVGVVSKFHQSNPSLCVDSASFLIHTKMITGAACAILLAAGKSKGFAIGKKAFAYSAVSAVLNSGANLILLIALLRLPASVQYPVVTGGVIVFSCLIDLIRGETVRKKELIAALVAFLSTLMMAF